jgi:uncharacterized membrane protein (DUF4010 family)
MTDFQWGVSIGLFVGTLFGGAVASVAFVTSVLRRTRMRR